jgi:hypothetical protein
MRQGTVPEHCPLLCAVCPCRRAELLQKELKWMADNRVVAKDAVGSKVDYWSL